MNKAVSRAIIGSVSGILALACTACSEKERNYAIPSEFCGIAVEESTMAPFMPPGNELTHQGDPLTGTRTKCEIVVDRSDVLSVLLWKVEKFYDPMAEAEEYKFTNRKRMGKLPFDGAGAVGDKNAMVTARCDAPDAPYVIVDVIVHEKVNDDVTQRRADIAEFIKTFTPKVKKEVGCTVGFLEEARHQATNDKGGDLTDASGKNRAYHLAGRAVTPFGGGKIGDPLQRGVDVIATAWLQEETNRINSEATAEHQMTYDSRNGQLRSLADEWYRVNRDWAEDPGHEDYSKNQGVYSEIAASANDGNKQAEGLAGDQ